ncbi:DUF2712 domain-containing protein [Priestia aryabhattai]|uniref:DUF2712 domain-containing protein n=1 Tax=Priestia aryabhattai TaxID=412384 RepID=UPI001ADD16B4|nr:DUF2712 domain-containing protein [Priestia aryabhattai]QTL52613.1 DUF2712 domain-containing protein [Priestia aryabhattai]
MFKKLKKSKGLQIALAAGILGAIIIPSSVSASDKEYGYYFTIKTLQKNSYSSYRWRGTDDTSNPWKVAMTYSNEPGGNTITRFWMTESTTKSRATGVVDVLEGREYYRTAYKLANKHDVCLTAENNNFNTNTYVAQGYWDEETR